MALGDVDYGLMGVVGGLTVFIVFFFNIMSGLAVGSDPIESRWCSWMIIYLG